MGDNSENSINSIILNLESLIKQYENVLTQYNQVETDYINYLHQVKSNVSNTVSDLVSFKNRSFWGSGELSSSRVSSVNECTALCSSTPGCSGATYNNTNNNTQHNCWLRKGEGLIFLSDSDQFAILPKSKGYLNVLQGLNSQLIFLNERILTAFKDNEYDFSMQDKERFNKYNLLRINYQKLEEQRQIILEQLENIQTLDSKRFNGELAVTKNYYNYILLFIIVILCCIFLSKIIINSGSNQITNNFSISDYKYVFLIIVLSIFILSFFKFN